MTNLLIGKGAHAQRDDRDAFAPGGRPAHISREDVLARIVRQMKQRDDEDVAITQLRQAGREDDPALASARTSHGELAQERAAAEVDRAAPQPSHSRLRDLRTERTRLERTLSALPLRPLARLDRLDQDIGDGRRLAGRSGRRPSP
jgi:hypothetical protein